MSRPVPMMLRAAGVLALLGGALLVYAVLAPPTPLTVERNAPPAPSLPLTQPSAPVTSSPAAPAGPVAADSGGSAAPVGHDSPGGQPPDSLWQVYNLQAVDSAGRPALFKLIMGTEQLGWAPGSLRLRGVSNPPQTLATQALRQQMARFSHVFFVGVASAGGSRSNEEYRAQERARYLLSWLQPIVPTSTELYALNLGQYRGCSGCPLLDGDQQRSVAIVGLSAGARELDLEQALRTAMAAGPLPPAAFSRFDMVSYGGGVPEP